MDSVSAVAEIYGIEIGLQYLVLCKYSLKLNCKVLLLYLSFELLLLGQNNISYQLLCDGAGTGYNSAGL